MLSGPATTPGAETTSLPADQAKLGAALRRSAVGCANGEYVKLSEAEREACRHRLADGAASTPYVSGIPPVKAQYYAAVAESEAKFRAARTAADMKPYAAQVVCGGASTQLGLKVGPCKLIPPQSEMIPEAGVQPP
jgi:hypothetical protein